MTVLPDPLFNNSMDHACKFYSVTIIKILMAFIPVMGSRRIGLLSE